MAKRVTHEVYTQLLEAYRSMEGEINHKEAERLTGIPYSTCKKAFNVGWPSRREFPHNGKSIESVLNTEKASARAVLAKPQEQLAAEINEEALLAQIRVANLQALQDLGISRAQQGKTIRASRANATHLLVVTNGLLKAAQPLVEKVKAKLEKELPLELQLKAMKEIRDFAKTATEIARMTDDMEFKTLGTPSQILNAVGESEALEMGAAEALQIIKDTQEAYARSQQEGILISRENDDGIIDAEFAEMPVEGGGG